MTQVLDATFEDGVLKPHGKPNLVSGAQVRIIVIAGEADGAFAELERFRARHPIHSRGRRLTRDQLHERH